MIWDIYANSVPFKDLNYNPELFYRISRDDSDRQGWDFGIYEHESNGRSGTDSRSWDRIYVRYRDVYQVSSEQVLLWNAKIWIPFNYDSTNSNLPEYRGIWELNFSLTNLLGNSFDESDLLFRLYPGGQFYINPFLGGQELTFRIKSKARKLLLPIVFQFFHGYGEYLLEYNNDHFGVRIGFGF
jgi:outer membrane phospholipase A